MNESSVFNFLINKDNIMKSWVTISTALLLILNAGTTLAQKDRVLVCHKGADKAVNESALKAHLGHGDTLGNCASAQIQSGQQTLSNQAVVTDSSAATSQVQQLSLQQILDQLTQQNALSAAQTQTAMPWQPVQGQTVYQYRYYPQASLYYDEGRGLYFYQQNGQWLQTQTVPAGLQTLVNRYVPMQMNTNLPYTYHPQISQTYTAGSVGTQSGGQAISQQTTTVTKHTVVTQTSTGTGQNQIQMPSTGNMQQGTSAQQMSINQKVTQTNSSGQVQIANTAPTVGTSQVITTTAGQANQASAVPANVGGGLQLLQTLQALQGLLNQQPAASTQVTGSTQVIGQATNALSQLQPNQLQYVLQTLQAIQQNPTAQAGMNAAQQQTLQNTLQQVISTLQHNVGLPIAGQSGAAVQTTTTTVTNDSSTTTTTGANANTSTVNTKSTKKVAICHKGKNTLHLPQSAVNAHLGHGDVLGACVAKQQRKIKTQDNKHKSHDKGNGNGKNK